ncbi:Protein kinase-like domain protein [Cordyceps fumosorosea ARSEF 2679]|uniref:non-specific serine/threonine protein kinase n=1 Tax=Cordyceps fumosorosea (strain ARSEF 2679) TaxID=1081104 RepID=A0A167WL82_CORFA|nr:Protein kinase-like domain protein [Cordyceps fumosorosea ARSEF 2679]OAA63928.1 Protein kinase-like domain protein [Cordyceps fumosorosea ARSEF 2679]
MCDGIVDFALFALHPMSAKTTNIVRFNQDCGNVPLGAKCFVVTAKQTSRRRRGMVTFGREQDNDIWYKFGYNRHLCTFTLTPAGDVVLLDNSGLNHRPMAGLVATTTDANQHKHVVDRYSMSIEPEFGGRAQQRRVVPMCAGLDLRVEIGRGCVFALRWCVPVASRVDVARTRALLARVYAARPQQYLIEEPPRNAPAVTTEQQALHARSPPETHWYGGLWRQAPGRTHEAVDLRTGRVYAVKRLVSPRRPDGEDDLGARQEWKRLARLQAMGFDALEHTNIQPPQFMDGWAEGHAFLDFYHHLYRGNSRDHFAPLVAHAGSHAAVVRACLARFAAQMLAALAYLDAHGVVHANIKPENVLYQTAWHPAQPEPRELVRFFLVDFAFGAAETHVGTAGYMAPETVRYYTRSGKTDLYALGITMLELLGVLAVAEFRRGMRHWCLRLAALTGRAVLEAGSDDGCEFGHRQVQSLCEQGVLSRALEGMLRLQSDKRQDILGTKLAFAELGDDAFVYGPR